MVKKNTPQNNGKLVIGNPVSPMLVKESGNGDERFDKIIDWHDGSTYSEVKSDGYRLQVHKTKEGEVSLFTRTLNPLNVEVFPELSKELESMPYGIFDGELVGINDGINGFNAVKKRVRGELVPELIKKFPLQVKYFDVLSLEGKDVIHEPLHERRGMLEDYVANTSELIEIDNGDTLRDRFEYVTDELGLEGLVCKHPESMYLIGGRNKDWIKLKKFINLDLTVLGLYKGQGRASKLPFAGLLLGTYDHTTGNYETITKVGLGNKEKIGLIYDKVKDGLSDTSFDNVIINPAINKKTYARKVPSVYVNPKDSVLVEVDALNITRSKNWHSCGLYDGKAYSLRIPIVKEVRTDKPLNQGCTTEVISDLYVE